MSFTKKWIIIVLLTFVALTSPISSWTLRFYANVGESIWGTLPFPLRLPQLLLKEPAAETLAMPVQGARVRSVADTWGAPRSGGRLHKGQDIFAPRGTSVYSATEGVVVHVGESELGGKTVFILGAGRRRYYYAHLDRHAEGLRVGNSVTEDTVIGYVGNTGNARTTSPHLHFGVFGAEGAINPLPLLRDRSVPVA